MAVVAVDLHLIQSRSVATQIFFSNLALYAAFC
jgi:hypothetical protein